VICPISIGSDEAVFGRTRSSQGKGAPAGSVGSGEVGGKCRCVELPIRRSEYGFEGHTRFFHKHAKKGLAIVNPTEVTGVAHEGASCFPEAFEAFLCILEERCTLGERIRAYKDP
jgi:hypothetical protein